MVCHSTHVRSKGVERQSALVTEEVTDEVCGKVGTEMMLSDHLYSCEFVLPPGSLCEPLETWVISPIPMCHLTFPYNGA